MSVRPCDPGRLRARSQSSPPETSELRDREMEPHHWQAQEEGLSLSLTPDWGILTGHQPADWVCSSLRTAEHGAPGRHRLHCFVVGEGMCREHGCV